MIFRCSITTFSLSNFFLFMYAPMPNLGIFFAPFTSNPGRTLENKNQQDFISLSDFKQTKVEWNRNCRFKNKSSVKSLPTWQITEWGKHPFARSEGKQQTPPFLMMCLQSILSSGSDHVRSAIRFNFRRVRFYKIGNISDCFPIAHIRSQSPQKLATSKKKVRTIRMSDFETVRARRGIENGSSVISYREFWSA